MEQVAELLGRHRVTVQKWAKKYRESGIEGLLKQKLHTRRLSQLPNGPEKALEERLQQEDGFNTYREVGEWLEDNLGITASYKTIHHWVHYRLKASSKVVRPQSSKQDKDGLDIYNKTA